MNDKIIYIHRDKNLVIDVFQWQEGKELELIKFGVDCKFKDSEAIVMYVGQYQTYNLEIGDYILKMQGNETINGNICFDYFVLPEIEFNEHVKKYSLKLIEVDEDKDKEYHQLTVAEQKEYLERFKAEFPDFNQSIPVCFKAGCRNVRHPQSEFYCKKHSRGIREYCEKQGISNQADKQIIDEEVMLNKIK